MWLTNTNEQTGEDEWQPLSAAVTTMCSPQQEVSV